MGNMTLVQAILCGVVYWLAVGNLPFVGLWSLQRPLVCGTLVGCILGDPVQGAVIGATINLVYLGFMSAGGSMPADMGLAGVLGTAYGLYGHGKSDRKICDLSVWTDYSFFGGNVQYSDPVTGSDLPRSFAFDGDHAFLFSAAKEKMAGGSGDSSYLCA